VCVKPKLQALFSKMAFVLRYVSIGVSLNYGATERCKAYSTYHRTLYHRKNPRSTDCRSNFGWVGYHQLQRRLA